ncbi:Pyroglutamylated RFamide peptide receptor [Trichoplax sp. H2]|nr:Pyroglutamylated RFamide peptide receptor [Trichoplax sp. H2]|eukprot:RDD41371.1 Pyroglutamylated RFamide peptide receptor [Trichoplax sp. H2]
MDNHSIDSTRHISTQIYRLAAIAGIPIFIFGLFINVAIFYLLSYERYFRSTTYKLIRISFVSDIISTITSLAGYILIVDRNLNYRGGTIMCQLVLYFLFASFTVSMMNLCLVGIDRYFNIVKPLSLFYRIYKKHILVLSEIIIWLIAIAVNIPVFIFVGVNRNDTLLCDIPNITPSVSLYIIVKTFIIFIIPTFVILIIYGKIISFQKSYIRPGKVLHDRAIQGQLKKKRFINMLIWISVSYIALGWPYFANIIGMAITRQSTFMIRQKSIVNFLLSFFTVIITTSIVILNPLLYLKFDLKVRKRFFTLFRRMLPCQDGDRRSSVTQITVTASVGNI